MSAIMTVGITRGERRRMASEARANTLDRRKLEARLAALPIYQYAFIDTKDLPFSDRVRAVCQAHCPMYDTTWACPPAVGTPVECRERILRYDEGLLLATVSEVEDAADMRAAMAARAPHIEITRQALSLVQAQADETLTLSAEACASCERCTWPDAPCRYPERMFPCLESHCIVVPDLAQRYGFEYLAGQNLITWFSLILYR